MYVWTVFTGLEPRDRQGWITMPQCGFLGWRTPRARTARASWSSKGWRITQKKKYCKLFRRRVQVTVSSSLSFSFTTIKILVKWCLTLNSFQLAKVKIKRCRIATRLTRCGWPAKVLTKVLSGADQGAPCKEHLHQESRAEERGEGGDHEGCRERAHCGRCLQRENLWHKIEHSVEEKKLFSGLTLDIDISCVSKPHFVFPPVSAFEWHIVKWPQ